jgi:superfamily II DNA or RNA helicase
MRIEFDGGTLLLQEASEEVPYAEWDDRVEDYRAPAYRYRPLLEWTDTWDSDDSNSATQESANQETIQSATIAVEDTARAYPDLALDPALEIEPREYQQAALDAWRTHDRRGSVVLPTGSGKTFLGIQTIADAGVATLVVAPTIDLMNQWHATLTNAFGDQLPKQNGDGVGQAVGVLGGGTHEISMRSRLAPAVAQKSSHGMR